LLAIFLLVLVAEFGLSIPFLMETVWVVSGYNLAAGNLSFEHLILFCVVGLVGRMAGSGVLFFISWYVRTPLGMLYLAYLRPRFTKLIDGKQSVQRMFHLLRSAARWITSHVSESSISKVCDSNAFTLFGRKFKLSPFTVALGRFFWLRLPITMTLGASRQRKSFFIGVAIFSVVWDSIYITFGVLGGNGGLEPVQMLLYPLGIMVSISALAFCFKRLRNTIASN
jgi:hypothetical protein